MKHSIGRYLRGSQKVYRFALYGRTAAGKTCLLAGSTCRSCFRTRPAALAIVSAGCPGCRRRPATLPAGTCA